MEFDALWVVGKPLLSGVVEPVTWTIVDDQEDLPPVILFDQQEQEFMEGMPVEHGRELVAEKCLIDADSTVDVGGFPHPEGVDPGLHADLRPCLVEGPIKPEAGFILEDYDAATGGSFFFISGNRSRSHVA